MTAIILVAGVARRLAPLTDATHKALLPVGGRPILARMLDALAWAGVRRAALVVGHCADQVRALAGERVGRMAIDYVVNPEYTRGSVLSLYAARQYLREPALVMDADVLFPREFLRGCWPPLRRARSCSTAASPTPARRSSSTRAATA